VAQDQRIDAYIAKAADFARPILTHLRALVHAALPDADETIKWGMPHFTVKGRNVAGMAAFKAHCAFIIHGEGRQGTEQAEEAMGSYGKIAVLSDLPGDAALTVSLIASRERALAGKPERPAASRKPKPELPVPDDLLAAFPPGTRANFESLAPSHRREYVEWIVGAKRPETRAIRIAKAAAQIADGKKLNWKYGG
jgi:uncharacterized protein YdeI (YjbR/CyaY-like superfamily)